MTEREILATVIKLTEALGCIVNACWCQSEAARDYHLRKALDITVKVRMIAESKQQEATHG